MHADDLVRQVRAGAPPPGGTEPAPAEALPAKALPDVHRRRTVRPVSRTYSRLVNLMKVALPTLALMLVALVAAWPTLTELPRPRLSADKGQLEMIRPHYFSADEKNQPYSVVAARAEQSTDQPGIVVLEQPEAEMTEKDGTWVTMRSQWGWYDQNTGILKMRGSVHVLRDDGTEFTTEEAYSDVRRGTAWGEAHVEGQGPQGVVLGEGFRMAERGRNIVFLNSKASMQSAETAGKKR